MVETPPPLPTDDELTQTESDATPEPSPEPPAEIEAEERELSSTDPAADPYESLFEDNGPEGKLGSPPPLPSSPTFGDTEEAEEVGAASEMDYDTIPDESEKKLDTKWIIAIVVGVILLLLCCCCATLAVFWTFGDQILGLSLATPALWLL